MITEHNLREVVTLRHLLKQPLTFQTKLPASFNADNSAVLHGPKHRLSESSRNTLNAVQLNYPVGFTGTVIDAAPSPREMTPSRWFSGSGLHGINFPTVVFGFKHRIVRTRNLHSRSLRNDVFNLAGDCPKKLIREASIIRGEQARPSLEINFIGSDALFRGPCIAFFRGAKPCSIVGRSIQKYRPNPNNDVDAFHRPKSRVRNIAIADHRGQHETHRQ